MERKENRQVLKKPIIRILKSLHGAVISMSPNLPYPAQPALGHLFKFYAVPRCRCAKKGYTSVNIREIARPSMTKASS